MAWSKHGLQPIRARVTYMLFYNYAYLIGSSPVECIQKSKNEGKVEALKINVHITSKNAFETCKLNYYFSIAHGFTYIAQAAHMKT